MSITITPKEDGTGVGFFAWTNTPKLARPVVEAVTRLGGSRLLIQETRKEAIITNSIAYFKLSSPYTDVSTHINVVYNLIGKRAAWLDSQTSLLIDPFYILDASYTTRIVDPENVMLVTWNITCTTDKFTGN